MAFSQVGVNTTSPQATFDIVGMSTDITKTDGLIAPRLKGSELKTKDGLYSTAQTGAIVYITEALASTGTTAKTANVTTVGYFYFDGTLWQKLTYGTFTETDGVIGNEVLNATANGGLTRAGSGTAASPYTLGLISGTANGQVMTWNGTTWNPAAVNLTEVDGVIGNEVLNATANGGLTRAGSGTAANPYTLGLTSGTANGQVMTWNGTTWSPSNALNIYNADGKLTGPRTLTQNGNYLNFKGAQNTQFLNTSGIGIQQDSGTGARSSIGFSNGGNYQLWIYTDTNNAAQINAVGNSTSLSIGTNNTTNPAGIDFKTSTGGGVVGTQRAEIDPAGKFNIINTLSVGYPGQQTFASNQKLKVNGSIATATTTYPDYVFEDYYDKSSLIKPAYKFTSLYETEKFIKENKHLPGVTSIKELEKTEEGYSFNISDLSVQSLEKIEELYLHTIEQQKQIDEQKNNIISLLKITEKLQAEIDVLKKQ
ncbi:hypothetical protein H5J24_11810 [Chryseobacterium capnotolerans]|uniref:hypothetical protein n=1 Tax=Chryseobacterium capnotolerans TaxID=2759528 RepID=UPI001E3C7148|nr:hypothetical protein [Chryseobacterium capnotolerans]UHO40575.1 hypothetical protein H5J24_11810 [Chryseobacterium capnotolerans]